MKFISAVDSNLLPFGGKNTKNWKQAIFLLFLLNVPSENAEKRKSIENR